MSGEKRGGGERGWGREGGKRIEGREPNTATLKTTAVGVVGVVVAVRTSPMLYALHESSVGLKLANPVLECSLAVSLCLPAV